MKKILSIALAVFVAFAIIGCSDDSGGGGGPSKVTITFEVDDTDCEGWTGDVPEDPITINKGTSLGTQFPAALECDKDGDDDCAVFLGWYIKDTTTVVTSSYVFNDSVTVVGKFGEDARLVINIVNSEASDAVMKTFKIWEGDTMENAGVAFPASGTKTGYVFAHWVNQTSGAQVKLDTAINGAITITQKWWNLELAKDTADNAADVEKLWLNNTQFAIYGFDISGKDIKKATHIIAKFKVSEATANDYYGGLRPVRPMGPYFYSDTVKQVTLDDRKEYFYGDFAVDALGAYAAKFNSDSGKKMTDYNKFHPYLLSNNDHGWSGIAGRGVSEDPGRPTSNTWFEVKVPLSGYGWDSGTNSITRVMEALDADTANAILDGDADMNTVYFGFGLANSANPHDAAQGYTATLSHGITSLIKDIELVFDDDSTVSGEKPSFPARHLVVTSTKGEETISDDSGTTDQVFAAYVYNIQYNWRGVHNAEVEFPANPDYTYVPPPPFDPTLPLVEIEGSDITVSTFGNTGGKTSGDDRPRVSVSDNVGTFDLQSDDYNDTGGAYGGGGIKIPLPEVEDWTGYEFIQIDLTFDIDTGASNGNTQVILSGTGGGGFGSLQDVTVNGVLKTGSNSQYITIQDGVVTFKFGTDNVGLTMAGSDIAICIRPNNWSSSNVPQIYTITVDKVSLIPMEDDE